MKIEGTTSLDRSARVYHRLNIHSGEWDRVKRRAILWMVFVPLIYAAMSYWITRDLFPTLLAALFGMVLIGVWYLYQFKVSYRKRLRRIALRALQTEGPVPFVAALDDVGISITTNGQTISTTWSGVREVLTVGDTIELVLHPLGVIILDEDDFRDTAEREIWLRTIKDRQAGATVTGSSPRAD